MAKNFKIDGNNGRVTIVNASNLNAITDPLNNLDDVHFHTDLDYLQFQDTLTATITLDAVPREYYTYSDGGCF